MYLALNDVLDLHGAAIQTFGGTPGLRDAGALTSALAQPAMQAFGVELYSTLNEKAAAYLFFLARNHPFVDGNKRTAYSATFVFLAMNGFTIRGTIQQKFDLVLATAQGHLPDVRAVAEAISPFIEPLG